MDSVVSNGYSETSQLTHMTKNTNYKDQESNAQFNASKSNWNMTMTMNKNTRVHPFATAVNDDKNELRRSTED